MKSKWLIFSYEHDGFWKPNRMGYTKKFKEAGRYSEKEAEEICKAACIHLDKNSLVPEVMIPEDVAAVEYLKHGDNW